MRTMPLRYNISNIRQLTGCKSNNSRDLSIHVTEFYNQRTITGIRVSVDHTVMGTLFAYTFNAHGDIISQYFTGEPKYEMNVQTLLDEIEKYGFYVTYDPKMNLKGNQIDYLMTVRKLGYNKIRVIKIWDAPIGVKEFKWYVVVFKTKHLPDWINTSFSPSMKEFEQALVDGYAINITDICECHKFRWDWLDYVANIDDIILDNAGDDDISEELRS